jgi:hypothetical protein
MRDGARGLAFCFVIAVSSTVTAAPERWSIQPPAGWTDKTEEGQRNPIVIERRKQLEASNGKVDFRLFGDGEGHALQILYTSFHLPSHRQTMDGFESGARDAVKSSGTEVSYHSRMDGHTLVGIQVIDAPAGRAYVRRLAGIDHDGGLLGIQAICLAAKETCERSLVTLALDPDNLQAPPDGKSTAYRLGGIIGGLFVCLLLGYWAWQRKR